ncbi:hypothetical protein VTN49DRAFT_894 [Thermomyces lanuginosus]|uniref:uncharacterized protein n=1 Tax=Thermomyces lanuginosus TaxID=5541 RepID=UPI003742EE55
MIIGRRWLAEKDVRLDVKNSAFLWPAEPSDLEKALPAPRLVPRRVLQRPMPSPLHQQDEERRDRALDEEIASEKSVQTAAARALEGRTHRGRACGKLNRRIKRHFRSPKSECFIVTLNEFDRAIEDKAQLRVTGIDLEDDEHLIDEKLPGCYKEYREVFSKEASDQLLPPRRDVDYRVELYLELQV